uniref:ATP synthase complex subunit 8 n=1 Tax=Glyptotermes sp. 17 AB-2022a TaxID=2942723 RepID=A0A8X8M3T2_9NEOP|nr:ATP synthase F0 subunit 8 [Glyptotermes sp. 17 AB-2022a]
MPQMMPLSWLILFMMFSMTLMLFASMNYYSHIPKTSASLKDKISLKTVTWKW